MPRLLQQKQNRSQLKTESSYGGTANDRIRSISPAARTVSDAELTERQKTKHYSELVYGYPSKIGPGMGNKAPRRWWQIYWKRINPTDR